MARAIAEIDWEDVTEYVPAVVTVLAMPLTFSIATGIGLGFITFAAVKLFSGRFRDVRAGVWVVVAAFLIYFVAV